MLGEEQPGGAAAGEGQPGGAVVVEGAAWRGCCCGGASPGDNSKRLGKDSHKKSPLFCVKEQPKSHINMRCYLLREHLMSNCIHNMQQNFIESMFPNFSPNHANFLHGCVPSLTISGLLKA